MLNMNGSSNQVERPSIHLNQSHLEGIDLLSSKPQDVTAVEKIRK